MTIVQQYFFVAGKFPLPVPALIKTTQAILTASTNNPLLPNPTPALATIAAALAALVTAEAATETRAKGTVPARNAARKALLTLLHAFKAHVQLVADGNPEQAESIITSTGFGVRKATARTKVPFAAKAGPNSGSVHLAVKAAARRASYDWEWSGDGGKTWTPLPGTLQAKTLVTGLPAATSVQFRYRAVIRTGEGDWSQPITLLVK
jgi:hypothetical protein